MALPAFKDAHLIGYQSKKWHEQAMIWMTYVAAMYAWQGARTLWRKQVNEKPKGFISRNLFYHGGARHCYVQAGSDWGKSSLLKEVVADCLPAVMAGEMSLGLIDGTEFIDEVIAKANLTERQIRERVILFDVLEAGGDDDIGCMPRQNMLKTGNIAKEGSFLDTTAKASVFEMAFAGLLAGNEHTGPMAAMLSNTAKTLARVDNPSVDDFLLLLRNPLAFIEDMPKLPSIVREYWQDEIKTKPIREGSEVVGFEIIRNETANALMRRAYQMVGNDIVRRMLCNKIETVDLGARIDEGCLFAVATRGGAAGSIGSKTIGRFFLSQLLRICKARNSLKSPMPTAIIVDEFPNYLVSGFDPSLEELLAEGRKMNMAFLLANQNEAQLSTRMKDSLMENCQILVAGGVSTAMAQKLRYKMGIDELESGPKKGQPNVDIVKLSPKSFGASLRGKEPIVIRSKRDALGDAFGKLPKGQKGINAIEERVAEVNAAMRDLYAYDPVERAIEQSANVVELREAVPI